MNNTLKVGSKVFTTINGKVCIGTIIESHKFDILKVPHGYYFANGFIVRWELKSKTESNVRISEHHAYEFGASIFASKDELIEATRMLHTYPKETKIQSCKDFYGLELKVGDNVKRVANGNLTGIIESIFVTDNAEYTTPHIKIVDETGYFLAVSEDPRCYTTVSRIKMTSYGGY